MAQILARAVGENGLVVGVDLVACASRIVGVITIAGDIREPAVAAAITARLGGPADLITSDLAPKLSGIAARDQARSAELIEAAIGVAEHSLRPGGAMVAKLFMGGDFEQSVAEFRRRFRDVQIARTEATRPGSSELYVVARDFYRAGERSLTPGPFPKDGKGSRSARTVSLRPARLRVRDGCLWEVCLVERRWRGDVGAA